MADGANRGSRALLVSPYFAPRASIGARRWSRHVALLADAGWDFDVVSRRPDASERREEELRRRLPAGTRLVELPAPAAPLAGVETAVWRLLRGVRHETHGATDAAAAPPAPRRPDSFPRDEVRRPRWRGPRDLLRAFWSWQEVAAERRFAAAAVRAGQELIASAEEAVRCVITSGPPHPVAEAGVALSRSTGLPFVLDLRDPWTLQPRVPEHLASFVGYALARRMEARAVAQAALVLVTSDAFRDGMRELHPRARVETVTNGWDEPPVPEPGGSGPFRIAFAGTLYLSRDPRPLLEAAGRLVRRLGLQPRELELAFMGRVHSAAGEPTVELARRAGLEGHLRLLPRGSQREAQAFMATAGVLVLLPWGNDLAVPAKLFDYVRHWAWILAFARPGSGVARILEGTGADCVAPDDVHAATAVLERRLRAHRDGIRPEPIGRDPRFSRASQAERLVELLETLGTRRS